MNPASGTSRTGMMDDDGPIRGRTDVILSALPASGRAYRLALVALGVSAVIFVALAPFAKVQLAPLPAFIPIYQSALVVSDLITAVLLFGQFGISRSRSLLVLACGYLFTALMTMAHSLSFPGLFAPGGLLGSGTQTTAWLYMFWHGGFPLTVLAYAVLKQRRVDSLPGGRHAGVAVVWAIAVAALAAALFTWIATAAHDLLPPIMLGNRYTPLMLGVVSTVWTLSLLALLSLWRRRPHTVLDLWLMVVMSAWLFDIALSAVLNAGRFDLGFYAGRIYGLLAATFVLLVLLLENGVLHAQLVGAHTRARKRAADLLRLGVQLAAANDELAAKNSALVESSRLKSEFMSNMSHELRTPLNAIIGFSEMMKDGFVGDITSKQREFVTHVFAAGQHLLALINDMLDLAKIEAGRSELDLAALDLDTLIADSLAMFSARAETQRVTLADEPGPKLGSLQADARRVRQIVDNLLSNAMKFTPSGGRITLRATHVDRHAAAASLPGFPQGTRFPLPDSAHARFVQISVTDTGIGIHPEDASKLFTPFTQVANPMTRTSQGTGLGLAMVRQLAEMHGGTVGVSSKPGAGSCFTVWLPWRDEASVPQGAVAGAPEPPATVAGPLALIIEDDDKAAALMQAQLEAERFRVRRVATAEAALALAADLTPDVITLDILLPGIDGWELLARLQQVPAWQNVPVVVVSVIADENRGFSLGASLVLQKPVSRELLARGLARLGLAAGGDRRAAALVIDDDPRAVEILTNHLHQCGHVVLRGLGGAEGIDLAHRYRPDVILLDLEMPDVSGFDVVEALKANPATARIPIIIVTARQISAEDRKRLNGHIHDIVEKSDFNHGRFIGEVQRAMALRR